MLWKITPKEAGGKGDCICDFGEKGIYAIKHISFQKVSTSPVKLLVSWGIVITMKDFSAFLDKRR